MNKVKDYCGQIAAVYEKAKPGLSKTGHYLKIAGTWAWRLRKFIFAIPIVWMAVRLAQLNYSLLPEMVGINLQNSGDYTHYITRDAAVYGPLGVTAACLLTMILSRRTLYPWLISLFSMALPALILLTNIIAI